MNRFCLQVLHSVFHYLADACFLSFAGTEALRFLVEVPGNQGMSLEVVFLYSLYAGYFAELISSVKLVLP
jgi:hypothetical protein